MIVLENITKKFDENTILKNLSLRIKPGERVSIIGPSGCGKSTTLRIIMELQHPDSGNVFIDGENIVHLKKNQLKTIRKKMGMVFQSGALFDSMTVGDNVGFMLTESRMYSDSEIKKIVKEKLDMVDLQDIEDRMPAELSGGMRKRVAIARAIAHDPSIILYDEPTTGLDPITSTVIENLINRLSDELKMTTVVVTHQLSTIYNVSKRIIMVNNGAAIDAATPQQAKKNAEPVIYNFLNGIVSAREG